MLQLVIVVLAIVLMAVVVAGGSGYIRPEAGIRVTTAENVVTAFGVTEAAFRSYRLANRGAAPTPDEKAQSPGLWEEQLAPYLPNGRLPRVEGFSWSYETDGSTRFVCLTAGDVGEAVLAGLQEAAGRVDGETDVCAGGTASVGRSVV